MPFLLLFPMMLSAFVVVVFVLGIALAEQNLTLHTEDVLSRSHPCQPDLPATRVVITVPIEQLAEPEIFTLSKLSKTTDLEILRSGLSAASSNNLSHFVFSPWLYPQSESTYYPCSVTDAASCRRGKHPLQSNSKVNTSQTISAKFAGSAALSKLGKVNFMLFLVVSFSTPRVRMSMV